MTKVGDAFAIAGGFFAALAVAMGVAAGLASLICDAVLPLWTLAVPLGLVLIGLMCVEFAFGWNRLNYRPTPPKLPEGWRE
jgi:hypothetical protein